MTALEYESSLKRVAGWNPVVVTIVPVVKLDIMNDYKILISDSGFDYSTIRLNFLTNKV